MTLKVGSTTISMNGNNVRVNNSQVNRVNLNGSGVWQRRVTGSISGGGSIAKDGSRTLSSSVNGFGATVTYNWQQNVNGTWGNAPGTRTNSTYVVNWADVGARQYRCIFRNDGGITGGSSLTSNTQTCTHAAGNTHTLGAVSQGTNTFAGYIKSTGGTLSPEATGVRSGDIFSRIITKVAQSGGGHETLIDIVGSTTPPNSNTSWTRMIAYSSNGNQLFSVDRSNASYQVLATGTARWSLGGGSAASSPFVAGQTYTLLVS